MYVYSHRLLSLSAFFRGAFISKEWQFMQRVIPAWLLCWKQVTVKSVSLNGTITSPFQGSGSIVEKGSEKKRCKHWRMGKNATECSLLDQAHLLCQWTPRSSGYLPKILDLGHQYSTMDGSESIKRFHPSLGELETVKGLWGRGIIPHSRKETLPMLFRQNSFKHMYHKRT